MLHTDTHTEQQNALQLPTPTNCTTVCSRNKWMLIFAQQSCTCVCKCVYLFDSMLFWPFVHIQFLLCKSKFETNCGWIDEIRLCNHDCRISKLDCVCHPLAAYSAFFVAAQSCSKGSMHLFHSDSNGYILCHILTMHVISACDWSFHQLYIS